MHLITLGPLKLEGTNFSRSKPLLLLAFLALETQVPRRLLAELFFQDTRDPRDSLSSALSHLRRGGVTFNENGELLNTTVSCDAVLFKDAVTKADAAELERLYRGPFAAGLNVELSTELEEWLYCTRERFALARRDSVLKRAEELAARGEFEFAGRIAAGVFDLVHAPSLDDASTRRLYTLLRAAQHPRALTLGSESHAFGLHLDSSAYQAQSELRWPLLGRERERSILESLCPGEWAWVYGAQGMGKTALLKCFCGTYISGKYSIRGLKDVFSEEALEAQQLECLSSLTTLLIDDWEDLDVESRHLLVRLRQQRFAIRVIVASRRPPAVAVEKAVELTLLSAEDLREYPELYAQTDGLPVLLAAAQRGEPLEATLTARLASFSPLEREIYGAFTLCNRLETVRSALQLNAETFGQALERWVESGLIQLLGEGRIQVRAHSTALRLIQRQDDQERISLSLARCSNGAEGLALYQRARLRWEEEDLTRISRLGLEVAQVQLSRGHPHNALTILGQIPETVHVLSLRARALERTGQYLQAGQVLENVTLPLSGLRATVAYRLGQPTEAAQYAHQALTGTALERAEGQQVLGNLQLDMGKWEAAIPFLRAAAALYLMEGETSRRGETLLSLAIVQSELGEDAEMAFIEVLDNSEHDPLARTRVLINLGKVYERRHDDDAAEGFYKLALERAEQMGAFDSIAKIWNNLGVLHHRANRVSQASQAYHRALTAAQYSNERLVQANVLGNLGMLHRDPVAMEEAIRLLEEAGQFMTAAHQRSALNTLRQDLESSRTLT